MVWLQNRFITTGLEPLLSHAEKSCVALHTKFHEYSNLIFFHFIIRGKMSIIRCDQQLF